MLKGAEELDLCSFYILMEFRLAAKKSWLLVGSIKY